MRRAARGALARLWPGSLAGQLALLLALALFVAQGINFALLLRERSALRVEQVAGPAATRVLDAAERAAQGRAIPADRGRVRRLPASPVRAGEPGEPRVAAALAAAFAAAGLRVGRVDTAVRRFDPRLIGPRRPSRGWRDGRLTHVIVVAVEWPGRGWLVQWLPWPREGRWIVWRLVGQTLILYGVILLPVLWIGRRISRPLRDLTLAAEGWAPGAAPPPRLPERGPRDMAATIAAFNALSGRVAALLDEKDRMLGALAHDLRTPLAALRVRIENVEDEGDRARMADTVAEMNRTLDDILSLARLGRPSEPPVECDVAALVDAVVADFRDLGADVAFSDGGAGAGRLTLRLRPALMRRAVRNLVENAVKYGGATSVAVEPGQRAVSITVADRGPGIPADRREAVFDAFTRLETSRNRDTGGIGLGLALARAIVRDAGGDVLLADRPGGGLAATIVLPRR